MRSINGTFYDLGKPFGVCYFEEDGQGYVAEVAVRVIPQSIRPVQSVTERVFEIADEAGPQDHAARLALGVARFRDRLEKVDIAALKGTDLSEFRAEAKAVMTELGRLAGE